MNRLSKYFTLTALLFIQGCHNDDCKDYACFTPPMSFVFEIVDKETRENLFTNGTYSPEEINVVNTENNSNKQFVFLDEDGINLISIGSIGWASEIEEVDIIIADDRIVTLYVDSERVSENCCNFTRYNEIRIANAEFQLDTQSGIYTVYIN